MSLLPYWLHLISRQSIAELYPIYYSLKKAHVCLVITKYYLIYFLFFWVEFENNIYVVGIE